MSSGFDSMPRHYFKKWLQKNRQSVARIGQRIRPKSCTNRTENWTINWPLVSKSGSQFFPWIKNLSEINLFWILKTWMRWIGCFEGNIKFWFKENGPKICSTSLARQVENQRRFDKSSNDNSSTGSSSPLPTSGPLAHKIQAVGSIIKPRLPVCSLQLLLSRLCYVTWNFFLKGISN